MELKKLKAKIKKHLSVHLRRYFFIGLVLAFAILFLAGSLAGYYYFRRQSNLAASQLVNVVSPAAREEKLVYLKFLIEVYDKVKEYYWDNISDAELINLYKAGTEKLIVNQFALKTNDKNGLEEYLTDALRDLNEAQKKEFTVKLASLILVNLNPLGRNGLYTTREEQKLKNEVQNINPEKDLYADLGLAKGASINEVKSAYEKKRSELEAKKVTSPEAAEQLQKVQYAYEVLTDQAKRERYDAVGAEPTVLVKLIRPEIVHLYIKRFSPTTFDELVTAMNSADKGDKLNTLILDLRSNIGGSIDILPYILGPFIGNGHYAYDFFRQGESIPYKTKIGWLPSLVRYKAVVILVDGMTQSTAELMAATLKKYNVGILVGKRTRGWGTIERVINLETQIDPAEKYSILLVHTLTLRDDNLPIEGNGVEPVVNIENPDWEKQLLVYFHYDDLIEAVKEVWAKNPANF